MTGAVPDTDSPEIRPFRPQAQSRRAGSRQALRCSGPGARLKRKAALTHPATRESPANVTRREMSPTRGQRP